MKLDSSRAHDILSQCGAPLGNDFHSLRSEVVEALISAADSYGYRKPRNANGSRARYWHAYLVRAANRKDV